MQHPARAGWSISKILACRSSTHLWYSVSDLSKGSRACLDKTECLSETEPPPFPPAIFPRAYSYDQISPSKGSATVPESLHAHRAVETHPVTPNFYSSTETQGSYTFNDNTVRHQLTQLKAPSLQQAHTNRKPAGLYSWGRAETQHKHLELPSSPSITGASWRLSQY